MGILSTVGKVLIYPISRPVNDMRQSAKSIKHSMEIARERRKQRGEDALAASKFLNGKSPGEKFEEVFSLNGWTEEQLRDQFRAARNTRRGMIAIAFLGLLAMLFLLWAASFFVLAILGTAVVMLMAGCVALATRFAWWEWQIEERSIYPFPTFLAREDLFRRVLVP